MKSTNFKAWLISYTLALFFLITLLFIFHRIIYDYNAYPNQISSMKDVEQYTTLFKKKYYSTNYGEPNFIPLGFYIQTFLFKDPNTVLLSGYLWLKYPKNLITKNSDIKVDFPEAISPGYIEKTYDVDEGDYRLIGWRFTGLTLYESFDYSLYPLDQQIVWIKTRSKELEKNIIYTPDLPSYKSTSPYDLFGLNNNTTVFEYDIKESYFQYGVDTASNDTSLGFNDFSVLSSPSLFFNIVVKRDFVNPLILHMMPIMVIWSILFGLTMVMTPDVDKSKALGASTSGMLTSLAGLFFAVVIANLNLRSKFIGQPSTYMEFVYFLTYVIIFLLVLNVHFISPSGRCVPSILAWRNNLLPRIIYWPIILGALLLVTLYKFPDRIFNGSSDNHRVQSEAKKTRIRSYE